MAQWNKRRSTYSNNYHAVCTYLIQYPSWEIRTTRNKAIRDSIAMVLRELRREYGQLRAQRERYHLAQICGQFPIKMEK
jgi:hypothetical protein